MVLFRIGNTVSWGCATPLKGKNRTKIGEVSVDVGRWQTYSDKGDNDLSLLYSQHLRAWNPVRELVADPHDARQLTRLHDLLDSRVILSPHLLDGSDDQSDVLTSIQLSTLVSSSSKYTGGSRRLLYAHLCVSAHVWSAACNL